MARFRAVLIDLDGTLLDTAPDLAEAVNRMLAGELEGKADEALFARALPVFERCYTEESGRRSRPYSGAREGVARLHAAGLRLACVTNKAERFTGALLEATGFGGAFDLCVCADRVGRRKPDPLPFVRACQHFGVAPYEALVLGDSLNDVQAARAAGCPVWCVPYGYNEGRPVESLECDRIVASLDEAARLVVECA